MKMEKTEASDVRQQNYFINFIKGIACILVVFIHVPFPGEFGQMVIALARTGVVTFFMVSGYYLYREDTKTAVSRMPRKIKKTAGLMAASFGIYLIWECFVRIVGSGSSSALFYLKTVFSIPSLMWFAVFSADPVVGHLWFLVALTGAYILFFLLFKMGKEPKAVWAMVLLETHIIVMALSNLNGWNIPLRLFRNVWFYGFPCMVIGYILRKYRDRIVSYSGGFRACFGIAAGVILTLAERYMVGSLQIYNGTLILMVCVFLLAIKNPCKFRKNVLTTIGRDYSKDIYIFHWMVEEIMNKIMRILGLEQGWYLWLLPIAVFCITLAGAVLLKAMRDYRKKKFSM